MRSWTTSIAQARFIKNPGCIPAVKIEAAYLLHFAQINLKTCESYPSERWREGVNSLGLALGSGARRGTKMREGHRRRAPQDARGASGFGRPRAPSVAIFCTAAVLASNPLFGFLYFIYTPAHTHTHSLTHTQMHACILKSSSTYATPLCGSLWFSAAVHDAGTSPHLQLHSAGIQLQPALQRRDWFFKDSIFWGGIFYFSFFIFFSLQKSHFY